MVQKVGDCGKIYNKKSVEYTYTYQTPDNKTDISTEKYIFEGELSYGKGILIPTKRQYKQSTWNADINDKPWIKITWSDIKFDTGITKEDFKKNN